VAINWLRIFRIKYERFAARGMFRSAADRSVINNHLRKTPKGRRTGRAPFSAEPWMASLKILDRNRNSGELCRGKPLSLVTFLAAAKKVTRQRRKRLLERRVSSDLIRTFAVMTTKSA
jgi:hypothetical protein